ncbi:hypothetical protein CoNPh19_CDS0074 [Staphylococcus phage S-CoN_Ph19]|nr:hypothetical protein CoNPh18_CDS0037 [Staphylococcus phage S-CoN_Ph18]WNM54621.1 hypothetical protein CoNPh19_CDS0074 [Staphylococcus phage S-CoN_Ph19]WNM54655.1 hypothetical protein CoNPh20_CDS0029 [Staphylococcus phage S-CoN_Ph20]WNM54850.1 hypothetical protein CoNPh22_CDS0066 [Staphylococcus phage S-CoN_Ph22]
MLPFSVFLLKKVKNNKGRWTTHKYKTISFHVIIHKKVGVNMSPKVKVRKNQLLFMQKNLKKRNLLTH